MNDVMLLPKIRKYISSITPSKFSTISECVLDEYRELIHNFPEISPELYLLVNEDMWYPILTFLNHGIYYYIEAFAKKLSGIHKSRDRVQLLNWVRIEISKYHNKDASKTRILSIGNDILLSLDTSEFLVKYGTDEIRRCIPIEKPMKSPVTIASGIIDKIPSNNEIVWFQDIHGIHNSLITINGLKAILRVEGLVFKKNKIYLGRKNNEYKVPGGAIEPGESFVETVIRETKEEARIITEEPELLGAYLEVQDEPKLWMQEKLDKRYWNTARYTIVYALKYSRKYTGYVAPEDRDSLVDYGAFYQLNSVNSELTEIHQELIKRKRRP